jgi:hypothetical protein
MDPTGPETNNDCAGEGRQQACLLKVSITELEQNVNYHLNIQPSSIKFRDWVC